MSLSFDLSMTDPAWQKIAPSIEALAAQAGAVLPSAIFPEGPQEVSLVLTDDVGIQALNLDYRGQDKPTNVLSFPVIEAPGLLGDIILARETIVQEAQSRELALEDHLSHLIIHGLLHLLGFDHIIEAGAQEMEAIEISALAKLGIANPYILAA